MSDLVGSLSIPSEKTAPAGSYKSQELCLEKKKTELVRRANDYSNNGVLQPGVPVPRKQLFSLAHSEHPWKRLIQVIRDSSVWLKKKYPMYVKVNEFLFDPHTFPRPL